MTPWHDPALADPVLLDVLTRPRRPVPAVPYPVPAGTALTPADWCAHCEEAISPVTLPPAGRAGWVHTGTARIRCTTVAGWAEPAPRPAR